MGLQTVAAIVSDKKKSITAFALFLFAGNFTVLSAIWHKVRLLFFKDLQYSCRKWNSLGISMDRARAVRVALGSSRSANRVLSGRVTVFTEIGGSSLGPESSFCRKTFGGHLANYGGSGLVKMFLLNTVGSGSVFCGSSRIGSGRENGSVRNSARCWCEKSTN